jgi:NADPH:quinone reductase-like Zn-dependent oxidoreductase/acyl carrier protein
VEEIKARCGDGMNGEASYAQFRRNGFHFGETFRRISRVWRRDGEALGEISTAESLGVGDYQIHPAMLDACFQVMLSALEPQDSARGLFLPSGVERMRFYGSMAGNLWSHVVISGSSEKSITATIRLTDEGGCVVALLEGFRCIAIKQTSEGKNESDGCFYQTEWQECGEEKTRVEDNNMPSSWILLGEETSLSVELAGLLKSSGDQCCHVKDSDGLEKQLAASQKTPQLIYLPKSPGEESAAFAGEICSELLTIVQKLLTCSIAARLTVVTRGAQSADEERVSPVHGSLLGLARVVMNEHPGFSCRVIDLAAPDFPDEAGMLFAELSDLSEEETALRGRRRLVPRLSRFVPKCKESRGTDTPFRLEVLKAGALDQIGFRPLARRAPGEGEVEIEIQAAGLNFRDVMKALGIYPIEQPVDELLGDECAGLVVAVGDGVEGLELGDEVIAISPGSFSKFITVHSAFVVRKPATLSPEEAVTLPVTFLTAHYGLNHLARIGPGERVLIHAAAGGVGLAAIQIARLAGAEIFATAGNVEKRALVARMGAAHVMDSRTLEFSDQVMEITGGGGVDVVLNSLSGDAIARSLSVLSPYGRFLEIGKRDIYQNSRLGLRPFSRNLSFFAIDLSQLLRDRPSLIARMLRELMSRFESRDLHPLPTTVYPIARATEAFREMAQGKHTGKIVLSHADGNVAVQVPPGRQITFSPDATYLVTGGVRGFGMAITEWMIERGARNIVLIGAGKASARSAREHLKKSPVAMLNIVTTALDISDEKAVNRLLSRITETMPSLKGVIHAAVQWDDGVLQQLTKKRMTDAFGAKAGGAWNLHCGTLPMPLDFFVMISSVSSLVGNPAQGSYAAANAYLDALAHHRRALGLPALTVNWGHLGEVGYAARHEKISGHLERYGVEPMPLAQALAMLERLLQSDVIQAAAMRVDWARWAEANPRTRKSRRYSMIISPEPSSGESADSGGIARAVREASGSERLALLETFIRGVGARVLGASPSGLDPARPLNELGLDSLMGIELVNRIEAELGVPFPTEKIVGGPSIRMLAAILDESLQEAPSSSSRDRAPDTVVQGTPENQVAR